MPPWRALAISISVITAAPATAQEGTPAGGPPADTVPAIDGRKGIGAGLAPGAVLVLYLPAETVSSDGHPDLRWEPEVAFARRRTAGELSSFLQVGMGLFSLGPVVSGVQGALGLRVQYRRVEATAATDQGLRLVAAVGGEWLARPGVSFGVEGQLGYFGGTTRRAGLPSSIRSWEIASGALVLLRLYPP